MIKVNNKDTRILLNLNVFASTVSIVDVEQENVCRGIKAKIGRKKVKAKSKNTRRTSTSCWGLCDLL